MADSTRQTIDVEWANAASAANVEEPTAGKQAAGWSAEHPPFQYFNWFWQMMTNMMQNAEQNGMLQWNSGTTYNENALTLGSDYRIYQSQVSANIGNDPVTDKNNWKVWVGQAFDTEYVPLDTPITTFGTVNIADLSGAGVDPENVRALCVGYYVTSNDDISYITATWPDGTTKTIVRLRDTDVEGGPTTYLTGEIEIPVNADTTSVTFAASGGGGDKDITIHGVIQRTF